MTPVTIFALFSAFIVGCQAKYNYSGPRGKYEYFYKFDETYF